MCNSKAQIFTTDLILASVVFLFILTITIVYSMQVADRVYLLDREHERQVAAQNTANSLLFSQGEPADWHTHRDLNLAVISSIGIVKTRNQIDSAKLQKLQDWNRTRYLEIKDLLGILKYDIRISVIDPKSGNSFGEFGLEPEADDKTTAVNRIADYNGQEVIIRLKVFKE